MSSIETLCIGVELEGRSYNICVVYRRPGSNFDEFMDAYSTLLEQVRREKTIIIGDANLDLLRMSSSRIVEDYVNFNYENSFFPLIDKPTRVSSHSATVIDHALCNFINNSSVSSSIVLCHISDHFAIHVEIEDAQLLEERCEEFYRDWRAITDGRLVTAVATTLHSIPDAVSPTIDHTIQKLITCIKTSIDDTCPLIPRRCINERKNKPWITPYIRSQIAEKNDLYSKYCKRPITFGAQFRTIRNHVTNLIRQSKANYFQNLLKSNMNNSRKTWETLNLLMNRDKKHRHIFNIISDDGNSCNNPQSIAEALNNYFVNAPANISASLPQPESNFHEYLHGDGDYHDFTQFVDVSATDIRKIVENFKNTGGAGYLDIPNRVLKAVIHLIDQRLADIFNNCLRMGYFPNIFKTAQVIPLLKSGRPEKSQNYRPISTLSCLSKILEILIFFFNSPIILKLTT